MPEPPTNPTKQQMEQTPKNKRNNIPESATLVFPSKDRPKQDFHPIGKEFMELAFPNCENISTPQLEDTSVKIPLPGRSLLESAFQSPEANFRKSECIQRPIQIKNPQEGSAV